jgi:hypothetical protein
VSWNFDSNGGHFDTYADGTAHIWGHVINAADPAQGFEVSFWLKNARNWADWSALGRSYKDDLNLAATSHLDWTYFEMVNGFSTLTGTGTLAGSHLSIGHYPFNLYYGFQAGLAANAKNGNNGMSGWFHFDGTVNGQSINGHGDINVDQNCTSLPQTCASTQYLKIYKATDSCGNTSFASQSIYVTDSTPPSITLEEEITADCTQLEGNFLEASDNCSGVTSITYEDEVIIEGCNGRILRHYTVTDGCGNEATADQIINLFSGLAPEFIDFPVDFSLECGLVQGFAYPVVAFEPGCANTTLNAENTIVNGDCSGSYTIVRTYTLTDDCGNEVSRNLTITVFDNTPPVLFNVPEDATINCGDAVPDAVVFALDNCSQPIVGVRAETEQLDCGYRFIRTWFTQDDCGNPVEASQVLTVLDEVDPFWTSTPDDVVVSCGENPEIAGATADDECSIVTVTFQDIANTSGACSGSFVRVYTATDGCGNTIQYSQNVTVVDNVDPVFESFPADATVSCDQVPDPADAGITFSDNCGGATLSVEDILSQQICANSRIVERVFTLTDDCGNTSSQTQLLYILDETPPVMFGIPADTTISCGTDVPEAVVVAIDNCDDEPIVSLNAVTQFIDGGYLFIRTWTATDACNNTYFETQTITVVDNEDPFWTSFPNDFTVECGDTYEIGAPTAEDLCGEVQITHEDIPLNDCAGSFYRVWTATDEAGHSISAEQYITIEDTTDPEFTFVPENIQSTCGANTQLQEPVATDACSSVTISFEDSEGNGCQGSFTRTYTATDACGNTAQVQVSVTITDNVGPQITSAPADLTVACVADVPASDESLVVFEDACSSVQVTYAEDVLPGTCDNKFTVVRNWLAIDACGNRSGYQWTITVNDSIAPELFGAPASDTLECGFDEIPELPVVTAEDNCIGFVPVQFTETTTTLQCGYRLNRTWTATDACGNTTTHTQRLWIRDTTDPVFDFFPADITLSCGDAIPDPVIPTAHDACAGEVFVFMAENFIPGECSGESYIQRVFRTFDNCGNGAIYAQLISIVDTTGPVFGPFDETLNMSCGSTDGIFVQATDACNTASITYSDQIISVGCANSILRTYTATDDCGNRTQASQTIVITDTTAPEFVTFPADFASECNQVPQVTSSLFTYFDECSNVTWDFTENSVPGACDNEYTLIREITLTDGCNNTSSRTWTIEVSDNTPPMLFGVPSNLTLECGSVVPDAIVFAQDNCSGITPVGVNATTTPTDCGSILTRTWFSVDACGNEHAESQVITFIDSQGPTLSNLPENVTIACGSELPAYANVVATDACQGNVEVVVNESFVGISNCPTLLRQYCATDCGGNQTCHTQTISFSTNGSAQTLFALTNNGQGGMSQVRFAPAKNGNVYFEVRNTNGQLVDQFNRTDCYAGELYVVEMDTEKYASGIYTITMISSSETLVQRLVVAR